MRPPRRRLAGTLGAAMLAVASVVWVAPSAGPAAADTMTCSDFYSVASSQGSQEVIDHTGFVVDEDDVDTPAAQALVDSEGDSNAYSGAPYPGTNALSVLGLANLPQSTYPLAASSSYPTTQDSSASAPGVSLSAHSGQLASSAGSTVGESAPGAASIGLASARASSGCAPDGRVTADAASDDQVVDVGGVLAIGRVRATAQVVVPPGGKPEVTSSLSVGQVTVAGVSVQVTPRGLAAAGGTTPLPSSDSVAGVLSGAGLSVHYLAPRPTADGHGIVSAGLSIAMAGKAQGSQPTQITLVLGQAYAYAGGSATPAGGGAVTSISAATPGGLAAAGPGSPASPAVAAPASGAAQPGPSIAPSGSGIGGAQNPPAVSSAPSGAAAASTASPAPSQRVLRPAATTVSFSSEAWYLVVLIGCLGLLGCFFSYRLFVGKLRWM